MGVAAGAWLLHVAALVFAPLSLVQAVLATGVIILAVLGSRLFGCSVAPRQWAGAVLTAGGLMLLVATLPSSEGGHATFAAPIMATFELGMLAVGALLLIAPRLGAREHHHGVLLGAAAGMLFGVSDVALKALTGVAADGPLALLASPWVLTAGAASVLAFFASARAFQQGAAVPVIASTSTAANVTCILGGIVVFGDALADDTLLIMLQVAAFAVVAAAALLTPAGHGHAPAARAA
jgi:hypothetical protein